MTRISFTRSTEDRPEGDPPQPSLSRMSLGFVVACSALAVLALALSLTVIATLRGLGKDHAPQPLPPLAVTAPVQPITVTPVSSPAPPPSAPLAVAAKSDPRPAAAPAVSPPAAPPAPDRTDYAPAMIEVLSRAKGVITLQVENDPGAEASARDMTSLFRAAGWTVNWNSAFGTGPAMTGFAAALGSTPQDRAVREAFAIAHIPLGRPPANAGIVQPPEIFVGGDDDGFR